MYGSNSVLMYSLQTFLIRTMNFKVAIIFCLPAKVAHCGSVYGWGACITLKWGTHRRMMYVYVITDLINVFISEIGLYKSFHMLCTHHQYVSLNKIMEGIL